MIKPTKKMHRFFVWRPGDTVYTMLPYVMHLLGHGRLPRGAAGWRHVVARQSTTQHVVPWRATRSSSQHDGATHCTGLHHSEVAIVDLAAGESAVGTVWSSKLLRTQCAMPAWPKQPFVNNPQKAAIPYRALAPQPSRG
jgi:hypothetical protein